MGIDMMSLSALYNNVIFVLVLLSNSDVHCSWSNMLVTLVFTGIIVFNKSSCSPLDHLDPIFVSVCMWVPHRATIF